MDQDDEILTMMMNDDDEGGSRNAQQLTAVNVEVSFSMQNTY